MISNIDAIRGISITDVISKWTTVKKKLACCPIHNEKSPSLRVHEDKGFFKCFGCGAGGDAIKFVQLVESCDFIAAAERVAAIGNITVEYDEKNREAWIEKKEKQRSLSEVLSWSINQYSLLLGQSEIGEKYLKSRGINQQTADLFLLGYAPDNWNYLSQLITGDDSITYATTLGLIGENKSGGLYDRFRNRLIFPYINEIGEVVSLSGRTLALPSDTNPKTMKGNNTVLYSNDSYLYGLYQALPAIKKQKCVHVVEGEFDAIQLYQNGVENVVACGNNRIKEEQCKLLKRFTTKVVLIPDNDSNKERNSGHIAVLDNLKLLYKYDFNVELFELPQASDPDSFCKDFINNYSQEAAV